MARAEAALLPHRSSSRHAPALGEPPTAACWPIPRLVSMQTAAVAHPHRRTLARAIPPLASWAATLAIRSWATTTRSTSSSGCWAGQVGAGPVTGVLGRSQGRWAGRMGAASLVGCWGDHVSAAGHMDAAGIRFGYGVPGMRRNDASMAQSMPCSGAGRDAVAGRCGVHTGFMQTSDSHLSPLASARARCVRYQQCGQRDPTCALRCNQAAIALGTTSSSKQYSYS